MPSPASAISRTTDSAFPWTPWSMPLRIRAGSARFAAVSRPSSTSPATSATASGLSSRRKVKYRSAARATAMSTPGRSLAGGSASTAASSSGLGGMLPIIPSIGPPCPPAALPRTDAPVNAASLLGECAVAARSSSPFPAGLALAGVRTSPASMPSASSPGPEMSIVYSGQRSVSSSCVPMSATRPELSSTAIRSARFSVERRCAISSVVRPCMTRCKVAWMSASIRGSTAEVASSSSSSRGLVISARASATRCRCPPDSRRPCRSRRAARG